MPASRSWTKPLFALIKIAISIAILTLLYQKAQQGNQFSEIAQSDKDWLLLTLAFVLCLAGHLVSFVRWRVLLNALDIPFTDTDAVRIGLIGSAFGLVSLGVVGGDSLRIVFAARHAKNKLAQVIGSVFTDRAIGMLTMFSFAAIAYLLIDINVEQTDSPATLKAVQYLCGIVSLVAVAGWVVVIAFLLSPKLLESRLVEKLKNLPKVGSLFKQLTDVVALYRKRVPTLFSCVVMSVSVNICFIGSIYCIGRGLNVIHPTLTQHCLLAPVSMCANAVPLPGGIGGMEPVFAFLHDAMSAGGEATKHGIVVAFSFRFALLAIAGLGAVAWFFNRKQIRTMVQEAEKSEASPESGKTVGDSTDEA